ncbi:threonine dehydratase [Roseibium denhamense]|uniref:L-threonine dehydratase n=1 Tax=Roseibium denhamense TaxID=76305 RepID=A0ABY1P3K8_9HYPH|nr:threonine ammonia-lyase IlvA [Roseibium denhamense]MTI07596.1 threonine dehydratase [Roseibium denhamense]SMP24028.1 L-threonine ammonia-lyase [Roseibium denhamense]
MGQFADEVHQIHSLLSKVLDPTPLQKSQYLSDLHQADIWLKREDLTPVRSYKVRGAFAFIQKALDAEPDRSLFVCSSAGNHAQGFAFACRHFSKNGVVFMPLTTPQQKIMKTRAFGAPLVDIKLLGDGFDAANAAAMQYCAEQNGLMVPPFDHPTIIRGQATVGKEILEQSPDGLTWDRLILPVGGGGLAAGITRYFDEMGIGAEFSLVEPDKAPSLYESLRAGERIRLERVDNFVDGAAVAQIGAENFKQLAKFSTNNMVLAPTDGVCATMIDMLNVEGVVLEPAGALAIDALKRLPANEVRGKKIVCVISGGNFDFERLPEVKERALKFDGLKKYYLIQLPQRPGALKDFLSLLGPDDDIARFEYLKKSARNFGSVLLGIETKSPENFKSLHDSFDRSDVRWEDITYNEAIANFVI